MEMKHREVLQKNWAFLIENISATDCIDHLIAHGCVSLKEAEEINSPVATQSDRTRALLAIIYRKGESAFEHFCEALKENYPHVVDKLRDEMRQTTQLSDVPPTAPSSAHKFPPSVNGDVFYPSDHVLTKGESLSDHVSPAPESTSQRSHSASDLSTSDLPGAFHAQSIAYQNIKQRFHNYQRTQEFITKGPPSVYDTEKQELSSEVERLSGVIKEKDRIIQNQSELLDKYDKDRSGSLAEVVKLRRENDDLKKTISSQFTTIATLKTEVEKEVKNKETEIKKAQFSEKKRILLEEKCRHLQQDLETKSEEIKKLSAELSSRPGDKTNTESVISMEDAQQLAAVMAERKREAKELLKLVMTQRRIIPHLTQQTTDKRSTLNRGVAGRVVPLVSQHDGMLSIPTQCTELQNSHEPQEEIVSYQINRAPIIDVRDGTPHSSTSEASPSVTRKSNRETKPNVQTLDRHPIGIASPIRRSDPSIRSPRSNPVERTSQESNLTRSYSGRSQVRSSQAEELSQTFPRKKESPSRNSAYNFPTSQLMAGDASNGFAHQPLDDQGVSNRNTEAVKKGRTQNFEKNIDGTMGNNRGSSSDSVIATITSNHPTVNTSSLPYTKPASNITQQNIYPEPSSNTSQQGAAAIKKPREHAEESSEAQICPICELEFTPPLSAAKFEDHVTECLSEREDSTHRVCPVCQQPFPGHVSMKDFEIHVNGHFDLEMAPIQ